MPRIKQPKVSIIFTAKSPPYNPGEQAGFSPSVAKRYVDAGAAFYADEKEAAALIDSVRVEQQRKAKARAEAEDETPPEKPTASKAGDEGAEWPKQIGDSPWFQASDGEKIQGKEAALSYQASLDGEKEKE